nr:tripartite tricarboxylate transporter TctB family protein [Devosia sp. 919]
MIFALIYLFEARTLPLGRMNAPGPGIYPVVVGSILALVSVAVIAGALWSRVAGTTAFPTGKDLRRVATAFGAFVLYVALLNVAGFIVATPLLVTFYTRIVGKISWFKAAASGIGLTLLIWAIFVFVLGVRLPTSLWG